MKYYFEIKMSKLNVNVTLSYEKAKIVFVHIFVKTGSTYVKPIPK